MSKWKRAAAVFTIAAAGVVCTGGASAWVASGDTTARAIAADLAARGIDPATVVWQKGARNYAGPNCPGRAWNCTTSTRVVQSNAAAQNVAECGPGGIVTSTASSDECVIVQTGTTNDARCTLNSSVEPLAEQTCDITQTGERNTAHVKETIDQTTGPTQEARQRAFVSQVATERNDVHVTQSVRQKTSLGTSQAQDAFQVVEIEQTATDSDNSSHVHQSQNQDESGSATAQTQNTADIPAPEFDCAGDKPFAPNQCADITQEVASDDGGKNHSHLHQSIDERQTTKGGTPSTPADQEQGTFDGGQEGDVEQTNPVDVGQNQDKAHQDLKQTQKAPKNSASQTQLTDPNCCGDSQFGGAHNHEDINQSVKQKADSGAFQFSELFGLAHQESAPPSTLSLLAATHDRCSITQHASNNSGAEHFKATASPCPFLAIETTCESGGEGPGGCSSTTFTEPPSETTSFTRALRAAATRPSRVARLETY